jgi:hypothetical protein
MHGARLAQSPRNCGASMISSKVWVSKVKPPGAMTLKE